MSGVRNNTGTKVPSSEPRVDRAKRRPAVRPASLTSLTANFTAKGLTIPNRTVAGVKRASVATKPPTIFCNEPNEPRRMGGSGRAEGSLSIRRQPASRRALPDGASGRPRAPQGSPMLKYNSVTPMTLSQMT